MNATDLMVRALRLEDAPAVAQLMSEHTLWNHRDRAAQSQTIAHRLHCGEYGLVAEYFEREELVLAGFVIMSDGTFGDHGYIRLIGVRQNLTSKGLGTRLLQETERLFVERGIRRAFLLCTDWNTGAQAFYQRHGYERVGALPDWLEDGVSELIFVKRDLEIHHG